MKRRRFSSKEKKAEAFSALLVKLRRWTVLEKKKIFCYFTAAAMVVPLGIKT